jgi:hypothetical protein
MKELLRRLSYLWNRRRLEREMAEEMAYHRELMSPDRRTHFGDDLRLREDSREAWGVMWIDRLGQDLRYAFRAMATSPGFTTAAVLVLAIGIGATVAAFSAFNMVALRPLPVRDPDSIVRFGRHAPTRSASDIPYPAVAFYREHARTLSAVLAQTESDLSVDGIARPASTAFITANFFDELGARPTHGRLFRSGDDKPDAPASIVLGHSFWASHFGSNPAVVGSTVRINGKGVTIIGVVGQEFSGLGGDSPLSGRCSSITETSCTAANCSRISPAVSRCGRASRRAGRRSRPRPSSRPSRRIFGGNIPRASGKTSAS